MFTPERSHAPPPGARPASWHFANLEAGIAEETHAIDITTTGRRVLAVFVEEFNRRHGPDSPWPHAVLNEWLERSPLAKVTFADAE